MTLKQRADLLVAQGALLEAQVRAYTEAVSRFAALVTQEPSAESTACTAREVKSLRTFKSPNAYACAAGHVHGQDDAPTPEQAAPAKEE